MNSTRGVDRHSGRGILLAVLHCWQARAAATPNRPPRRRVSGRRVRRSPATAVIRQPTRRQRRSAGISDAGSSTATRAPSNPHLHQLTRKIPSSHQQAYSTRRAKPARANSRSLATSSPCTIRARWTTAAVFDSSYARGRTHPLSAGYRQRHPGLGRRHRHDG